jgi:hypothetical protein
MRRPWSTGEGAVAPKTNKLYNVINLLYNEKNKMFVQFEPIRGKSAYRSFSSEILFFQSGAVDVSVLALT